MLMIQSLSCLPASEDQLRHLKTILTDYATSTDLKINFHKSSLIPINMDQERRKSHCLSLYLWLWCWCYALPLFGSATWNFSTNCHFLPSFLPLVDRIERRMSSTTALLSYGGKLTIVNSVLSSLATYTMCSLQIPVKLIDRIDKIRISCLWSKRTANGESNNALVAWDKVCRPKKPGGLGVLNMRVQNQGLLLKHLDKFFNKCDIPWVNLIWESYYPDGVPHASAPMGSFWWKAILKSIPIFRGITSCQAGMGDTILSWKDSWTADVL